MLKWLGGGSSASNNAGQNSNNGGGTDSFTHVGKVFIVNEYHVVVEELIAEGGFAVVYRARSNRGNKTYALKRMAVNNEQDLYLARQEIAITKALSDCPNSVTFISSSVQSISPDVHEVLILLQLYTGQSVVELLNSHLTKRTHLPERDVLKLFLDVVVAVARLHHRTKPIIHRDLKIENILCDSYGVYLLCDYGSCTVQTMHPETMGASQCEDEIARFTTLAYRAPEMVSLYSGKTISTKADVWAMGCLLYKLCFMTTPFGEQPLAIVSAQFTIPQDSIYSEDLHSLIVYMLEPDPDKRPTIWQVNAAACRILGRPNMLPNVFRSPRPPEVLPRARKSNETKKTAPAPDVAKTKVLQSTPANPKTKAGVSVTTTSISSRERPRARGAGNTSTTETTSSTGHSSISRHHSNSPPVRHRPSNQQYQSGNDRVQHLRVQERSNSQTKSWDSGLDMFGAVPFNTPEQQFSMSATSSPTPSTNPDSISNVRRDLFGCTPFTPAAPPTSPPSSSSLQQAPHSHASPTQPSSPQTLDDFGAQPFVICS